MSDESADAPAAAFVSPAEYAARTGLSRATVTRRLKDGALPRLQPGGPRTRVLIPVAALAPPAAAPGKTLSCERPAAPPARPRGPKPKWTRPPTH